MCRSLTTREEKMAKSKGRVYARVGDKPSDEKCPFVRFNPNSSLSDEAYEKLRALIKQQLDEALGDPTRKRHSGGHDASVNVGFYLGKDGKDLLADTIILHHSTFGKGGLYQDSLRVQLEAALEKAKTVPA